MNKFILLILAICSFGFYTCSDDDFDGSGQLPTFGDDFDATCYEDNCAEMVPFLPVVIRSDNKIEISVSPDGQSTASDCLPDYYDLYQSINDVNFVKVGTFDRQDQTHSLDGFNGEDLHYFKVISKHCDLAEIESISSMTSGSNKIIPNQEIVFENKSFNHLSLSSDDQLFLVEDQNKLSYFHIDDPQNISIVESNAVSAVWQANENVIVYIKKDDQGKTEGIFSFNINNNEKTNLLALSGTDDYDIKQISFSQDEQSLLFTSNENSINDEFYNLWVLNLTTYTKEVMTDLEDIDILLDRFLISNQENNIMYFNCNIVKQNNKPVTDIYRFDIQVHKLEPFIENNISESVIAMSEDGSALILNSKRNGLEELWLYKLASNKFNQLTDVNDLDSNVGIIGYANKDQNEFYTMCNHQSFSKLQFYTLE